MAEVQAQSPDPYFVPHHSRWPIRGSVALFVMMTGAGGWLNKTALGRRTFIVGVALMVAVFFGWFGDVIRESVSGKYNRQVDVSFRMGMIWFIFSVVMFFVAFFGSMFFECMHILHSSFGDGHGAHTTVMSVGHLPHTR